MNRCPFDWFILLSLQFCHVPVCNFQALTLALATGNRRVYVSPTSEMAVISGVGILKRDMDA